MKTATNKTLFILLGLILAVLIAIFLKMPITTECGACGANVYETWSVRTMDNSGFATVCEKCYDDCRESN